MREELGDRQREIFLREQMKAIQKELGEGDEPRRPRRAARTSSTRSSCPEEVRKEVDRELGRLQRIGRESMESQVIRTYLETVAELPWNTRSEEQARPPGGGARSSTRTTTASTDVKDRVLEFLAVRQLRRARRRGEGRRPPPAERAPRQPTGDAERRQGRRRVDAEREDASARARSCSSSARPASARPRSRKSIARAMGRKYVRISLGGARDEADIRGHRRTYVGAMPGRIIQGMKQAGTKNPVFLLDEVDKLGVSFQGDPASALLEVLDPAQNDTFTDHYLGVPFDLSEVLFIATANFIAEHPGAAARPHGGRSSSSGYTEREKLAIARQLPAAAPARGERALAPSSFAITDGALAEVITQLHPRGRRAAARARARQAGAQGGAQDRRRRGAPRRSIVDTAEVRDLLGRPRVHPSAPRGRIRSASRPACSTRRSAATSCSSRRDDAAARASWSSPASSAT